LRPDDVEVLSDGRLRRRWYRRTVWAIADARTGRQSTGRTPGTTTGLRKPHPYADDPRLSAALELLDIARAEGRGFRGLGIELAVGLGVAQRTAQRLLAAAAEPREAVLPIIESTWSVRPRVPDK
jgi:hypothetical protein